MPLKQSTLFSFEHTAEDGLSLQPGAGDAGFKAEATEKGERDVLEIDAVITVSGELSKKTNRGRKKLSDHDVTADLIDVPADDVLFQKKYYSIGLVAKMFRVNISLIRFWENEFDLLKPKKNGKGDRHFRPEDIINLKLIYHLLREKKYTIEGARDFLKKNKKADEAFGVIEELKKLKSFLNELKLNL